MRRIPLTQGQSAIVDDEDYDQLIAYQWGAHRDRAGGWHAHRRPVPGGTSRVLMSHIICSAPVGATVKLLDGDGLNCQRLNLRFGSPPIDGPNAATKLIPLSKGQWAVVDTQDAIWLSQWIWHAHKNEIGHTWYAQRNASLAEVRNGSSRMILMHRAIVQALADAEVDHRNLDGLDNRRENLRQATETQNRTNRPVQARSQTGLKGVKRDGKAYVARIRISKKLHHLGTFKTALEAAEAYDRAHVKASGEFARPNFRKEIRKEELNNGFTSS